MGFFQNIIAIWSGSIVDIPDNWQLCDGTNGAPDLRNIFIQGSQGALAIGDVGGNTSHTHTFTSDGHTHNFDLGTGMLFGDQISLASTIETDGGRTNPNNNTTPFFALAFIMRMS